MFQVLGDQAIEHAPRHDAQGVQDDAPKEGQRQLGEG